MKAKELKDKTVAELTELHKTLQNELFQSRLQNFTNQLDDTSSIPKKRRDLARLAGELRRRELEQLAHQIEQALTTQATESR
jgi:ribosomal protein L29